MRRSLQAAAVLTAFALPLSAPLAAQHSQAAPSIPAVAKQAGLFTTLLAAVNAAGLTETLLGRGPFTLLAPTDEAFGRLPAGTVEDLLKPANREKLVKILTYHVLPGRVTAAQARGVTTALTVANEDLRISTNGDQLRINDATVRVADIPASNGVIHIIDRVLLPTERRAMTGSTNGNNGRSSGTALALVELAIQRGVPLFNNGVPDATVAIYEVATRALLALGDAVPSESRRALQQALGDTSGSISDRAFTLRAGLDVARRELGVRMESHGGR